jgi:hypothetical protein
VVWLRLDAKSAMPSHVVGPVGVDGAAALPDDLRGERAAVAALHHVA